MPEEDSILAGAPPIPYACLGAAKERTGTMNCHHTGTTTSELRARARAKLIVTRRTFCWALGGALALAGCKRRVRISPGRRVVVLGMDGIDPKLLARYMAAGDLPTFTRLKEEGGFVPLPTTNPPQSPVSWATLATGVNPGEHGVFDFLRRHADKVGDPAAKPLSLSITRHTGGVTFEPPMKAAPFWETAAAAGVPATVLRWPLTFPARGEATILAGLGAPDIRGRLGMYALYTTDADAKHQGLMRHVPDLKKENGQFVTAITGPDRGAGRDVTLPLRIQPVKKGVKLLLQNASMPAVELAEGTWSRILSFTFTYSIFRTEVKATGRFYLARAKNPLILYLSPLAVDPADPGDFEIGNPHPEFVTELARRIGPFHTLGMPEDVNAVKHGALGPEPFLSSCNDIVSEQEKMLQLALADQTEGLLAFVFFTSDRIQHFFWAGLDPAHPYNTLDPDGGPFSHVTAFHRLGAGPIRDIYKRFDRILDTVRSRLSEKDVLLLVSDHGFTTYRRNFHVNRFLVEHGFMTLRDGAAEGDDFLATVAWDRTRAYSVGFAGIYLNREGREGAGRVAKEQADDLARQITTKATALRDPATGTAPVLRVYRGCDIYTGSAMADAPDLVLGLADGYRFSAETALGACPAEIFADNTEPWTGTHLLDPSLVPGILLANRRLTTRRVDGRDLAPTVLAALGVPIPPEYEGRSFLPKETVS